MMLARLFTPAPIKETKEANLLPQANKLATRSPLIAVLGAKGGAGASTVAINLAASFAKRRLDTAIIDGNFQQPDLGHLLGIEPIHSIFELTERASQADKALFEACSLNVTGGNLRLLSAPLHFQSQIRSNLTDLTYCLKQIIEFSRFWVIDLPRSLDKHLVTLMDSCEKIVLVFEATVTGVAACKRWLSIFRELDYPDDRIVCVLNRAGSKFKGVEEQLSICFDNEPIFRLPNASSLIWESETRGVPAVFLNAGHRYSRSIISLATQISTTIDASSGGK
jgi:pilus assembly protein CpaE